MFRILISYILPLALPTALYFAWAAWLRKTKAHHERPQISTPWLTLILMGLALMSLGLVVSVVLGPKNPPGSVYQPPRLENGKVIPGQFVPKPTP